MDRNRVKRLLREAFAREADRLPAGSDAVVIARQGARDLASREGLAGIQRALAELIDKVPGAAPTGGSAPRPIEAAAGPGLIEGGSASAEAEGGTAPAESEGDAVGSASGAGER